MNKKIIILYILFFVISFWLAAIIKFPAKSAASKLASLVTRHPVIVNVAVFQTRLHLPAHLKIEKINLDLINNKTIPGQHLVIKPNSYRFWTPQKQYKFSMNIGDAGVKGIIEHIGEQDLLFLNLLNISRLKISDGMYHTPLADIQMNGILNGKFEKQGTDGLKTINIDILNASFQLKESIFNALGISSVDFSTIKIESTLKGTEVNISDLRARGEAFNIRLSGSIYIQPDYKQSKLKLEGDILPTSRMLMRLENIKKIKTKFRSIRKNGLMFKISGTLEDPKILL